MCSGNSTWHCKVWSTGVAIQRTRFVVFVVVISLAKSKDLSVFRHFRHLYSSNYFLKCLEVEIWRFCVDKDNSDDKTSCFTPCAYAWGNYHHVYKIIVVCSLQEVSGNDLTSRHKRLYIGPSSVRS